MVKPFLLLSIRADDAAADNEYEAFLGFSGLGAGELRRVRLDQRALGEIELRDWSGIVLGGGPFNYSQPDELKSPVQRRVEADISGMLDAVVDADFPFLGACYGIGALGRHQGAVVDRRYSEPVGYVQITLTPDGRNDPLLGELPGTFGAFTGHKEAISELPGRATLLARSHLPGPGVPGRIQRLRDPVPPRTGRGRAVHPDRGLQARRVLRAARGRRSQGARRDCNVVHPPTIVRQFVLRYGTGSSDGLSGGRGGGRAISSRSEPGRSRAGRPADRAASARTAHLEQGLHCRSPTPSCPASSASSG